VKKAETIRREKAVARATAKKQAAEAARYRAMKAARKKK